MFKAAISTLVALAAAIALTAPVARAEPVFHSELPQTTITSTPDGSGKTAHQVFDFSAVINFTCPEVSVHGLQTATETDELKLTPVYPECSFGGQPILVQMRGCVYVFHANGEFDIANREGASCSTNPMEVTYIFPSCRFEIGPQSSLKEIKFHNITTASTAEITVEQNISGIKYTTAGTGCLESGTFSNGRFTTGNLVLTGEGIGTMANIRWE